MTKLIIRLLLIVAVSSVAAGAMTEPSLAGSRNPTVIR